MKPWQWGLIGIAIGTTLLVAFIVVLLSTGHIEVISRVSSGP
ncbi:MAG: hypothetical protein ACO1SV_24830 [Fimbriimonas sp.]